MNIILEFHTIFFVRRGSCYAQMLLSQRRDPQKPTRPFPHLACSRFWTTCFATSWACASRLRHWPRLVGFWERFQAQGKVRVYLVSASREETREGEPERVRVRRNPNPNPNPGLLPQGTVALVSDPFVPWRCRRRSAKTKTTTLLTWTPWPSFRTSLRTPPPSQKKRGLLLLSVRVR